MARGRAKKRRGRLGKCARRGTRATKTTEPCPWFLYVVKCADRTFYVGIAKSVEARVACHNAGRGAKYTRTRTPVRLVHTEKLDDVGAALRREREVKRWSRPKKVARLGLPGPERLARRRRSA